MGTNDIEMSSPGVTSAPSHRRINFQMPRFVRKHKCAIGFLSFLVIATLVIMLPVGILVINVERITVQSANTKQLWMDAMAKKFNKKYFKASNGKFMKVKIENTGSTFDEDYKPSIYSPAVSTWVNQLVSEKQIISDTACPPTVRIPLGIAMWKPMAEKLGWPNVNVTWSQIADLATVTNGWSSVGGTWGTFKYGHGHPKYSNSGRLSVIAAIHGFTGRQSPLDNTTVWSTASVDNLQSLEQSVFHLGRIDTDLLDKMVLRGIDYLHGVVNYESNVIRYNKENSLENPLVFVYLSDGTFWNDHPICIVDKADWSTDSSVEVAKKFRDFILEDEQQKEAIQYGIRPASSTWDLVGSISDSPFTQANGVLPHITIKTLPTLPTPPDTIVDEVIRMWYTVRKPASLVMVIDSSGSMEGSKMQSAIAASQEFVTLMSDRDEISIYGFSSSVYSVYGKVTVGDARSGLLTSIGNMEAGGSTSLYDATVQAVQTADGYRQADISANKKRNFAVILMTDGEDTSSSYGKSQMLDLLPSGTQADQVHIYTIAFGSDADTTVLQEIAEDTNGKFFEASEEDIETIYTYASSEF